MKRPRAGERRAGRATAVDVFSSPSAGLWRLPFARPELRSLLEAMLAASGESPPAMELVLVPDGAMEELNRKHLHLPGPTNILSFPAGKDFPGSLVLAPETMRRECFLYGQNPQEHVLRLLAHGLAHLLGREHGPEMDRLTALMEKAGRIAAGGLSTVAECRYAPLGGADEYFQGQSAPLAPSGGGGNP